MLAMKAIKGAGWLVFSRFLGRSIDVLTILILARMLTPADFGITAFAITLVVMVDTILEVPVTQALLRLKEIDKSHLDTGFTLGVARSVLVTLAVMAAASPFAILNDDRHLLPLVAALAVGPTARGLCSPNMVSFVRELGFRQTFVMELSGKLFAFALAMVTVLNGGGYWAIVANFVMAPVVAAIVSYVLAPYRPALSLSRFSDYSSFIGWFSSAQIVSALNWQFDRILIGAAADKATLGRYAVASDLAVTPTQSLIGPALQPVMAAFSKISSDPERLKLAFLKAVRFAMLISIPACLGISLTADLIVALLLGPKWTEAAPLLQLLALSIMPIPYFQTLYSLSLAVDRPIILFKLNLIDFGLRVLLVSAGFYLFSVIGVAIARGLISAIMFIFYLDYARRLAAIGIEAQLRNIWKVVAAALVMTAAVLALRHELAPLALSVLLELAVTATVGAAIYGGVLLACGVHVIVGRERLELVDRW
jgi:lipopolysaccharide exporter